MSVDSVETPENKQSENGHDGGGAPVSQTVAVPATAPATDLEAQALAAARGDRNAFKAIVDRTDRPLYVLAYHLLGDAAEARDAVQEAYLRSFVNLPHFRPRGTGTCLAWLRRITLNICRDWVRAKRPALLPDEADLDAHSTGAWSEAAAVGETADPAEVLALEDEDLREAVRELPMKYREVVVLRYSHDLSYAEMS